MQAYVALVSFIHSRLRVVHSLLRCWGEDSCDFQWNLGRFGYMVFISYWISPRNELNYLIWDLNSCCPGGSLRHPPGRGMSSTCLNYLIIIHAANLGGTCSKLTFRFEAFYLLCKWIARDNKQQTLKAEILNIALSPWVMYTLLLAT